MSESDEYPAIDFVGYYNVSRNCVAQPDPKSHYYTLRDDISQPSFSELNSVADAINNFSKKYPCGYTIGFNDRTALIGFKRPEDISITALLELQSVLKNDFSDWRFVLDNDSQERVVIYPGIIRCSTQSSLEDSLAKVRKDYAEFFDSTKGSIKRQLVVVRERLLKAELIFPSIICVFDRNRPDDSCYCVWIIDEPLPRSWLSNEMPGFRGVIGFTDYYLYPDRTIEYRNDIITGKVVRKDKIIGQIKCLAIIKPGFDGHLHFREPQSSMTKTLSFTPDTVLSDRDFHTP